MLLGIAAASIIMFVGHGAAVIPQVIHGLRGGPAPDPLLTNALLLNIALLLFGWRRHRALSHEIRERIAAEAEARRLSDSDPLTGCLNRSSLTRRFDAMLVAHHERPGTVAVLLIDLDHFKLVNDVHGHQTGDDLLVAAAQRLTCQLPAGSLIARLGGDEFACAVPVPHGDRQLLATMADALIAAMAEPFDLSLVAARVTLSAGVCTNDPPTLDARTLLHRADMAMYHAKKHGKNRWALFEPVMEREHIARRELEAAIRHGLAAGEFVPYYEQQIDIETGALVGFEMLARWLPEVGERPGPDIFIPVAEESGLIAELSDRLTEQALADAAEWPAHLTLSINISPVQLRDPWFAQKLLKRLLTANIAPSRLVLEITENCLHGNLAVVHATLLSLRNQGVRVSLDDFGTGYSSIAQLRQLPFDRIKIDRSFVRELGSEGARAEVVEAMISLGRGLGLPITVEGIENSGVLRALSDVGQVEGQGYHYGFPESAAAVRARLAASEQTTTASAAPRAAGEAA